MGKIRLRKEENQAHHILVMGANIKPLKLRLAQAERQRKLADQIYILGNDPWPIYAMQRYRVISGNSTFETLSNFRNLMQLHQPQIVQVISCWYHLPRCWLILRHLGFRHIQLVPATWRWWETQLKTLRNEIRSLRGCLE